MPVVQIPTAYRGPTLGAAEVTVSAATVLAALREVESQYNGFLPLILDDAGKLQRFVKLFINKEQIDPAALDSPLAKSDCLEVLAAIAGG